MDRELAYRSLLAVDIEHSSGRGNVALLEIRDALATTLRESLELSGIDWTACLREDLGDGFRITMPAGVPKTRLVHPLLHELAARLRAHNRLAGPATRIRVRTALHAGDVFLGPNGEVAGRPFEVLARMLDAAPVRAALAEAPESVPAVALLSQHFYDETVPHGYPGIEPETFRKIRFTTKEYTADAWLHPAATAVPDPEATAPRPAQGRSKMVNKASGHGVIYATQNGVQHINGAR